MSAVLYTLIPVLHWLAGLWILAEALNKLERSELFEAHLRAGQRIARLWVLVAPWKWRRPVFIGVLKVQGWALIAVGAAGAVVTPLRGLEVPTLQDAALAAGFALLILRTRLKEG